MNRFDHCVLIQQQKGNEYEWFLRLFRKPWDSEPRPRSPRSLALQLALLPLAVLVLCHLGTCSRTLMLLDWQRLCSLSLGCYLVAPSSLIRPCIKCHHLREGFSALHSIISCSLPLKHLLQPAITVSVHLCDCLMCSLPARLLVPSGWGWVHLFSIALLAQRTVHVYFTNCVEWLGLIKKFKET